MFVLAILICAPNLLTSCDGPYREEVTTCANMMLEAEVSVARTGRLDSEHRIIATCDKKFTHKDH